MFVAAADIASIPPDFEYGVLWVSSQYGERPPSALLAGDINLAKDWVSFVLGPLADDDLETARLRATLEVFPTIGSNYTMAADKLHVHPNTIKYRIHNAQDRLRVTTNDGRIDVALALVLWSRLGAAVLTNDGTKFLGGCSPVHRRAIRIGMKSIDTRTRRSHDRDGIASEEWS